MGALTVAVSAAFWWLPDLLAVGAASALLGLYLAASHVFGALGQRRL